MLVLTFLKLYSILFISLSTTSVRDSHFIRESFGKPKSLKQELFVILSEIRKCQCIKYIKYRFKIGL